MKLTEIMLINEALQKHKENGGPIKTVAETWDHLQVGGEALTKHPQRECY